MKQGFKERIDRIPSKGGLIGAFIGVIATAFFHKPGDGLLKTAGKTALLGGAGFLMGNLIESKNTRQNGNDRNRKDRGK